MDQRTFNRPAEGVDLATATVRAPALLGLGDDQDLLVAISVHVPALGEAVAELRVLGPVAEERGDSRVVGLTDPLADGRGGRHSPGLAGLLDLRLCPRCTHKQISLAIPVQVPPVGHRAAKQAQGRRTHQRGVGVLETPARRQRTELEVDEARTVLVPLVAPGTLADHRTT